MSGPKSPGAVSNTPNIRQERELEPLPPERWRRPEARTVVKEREPQIWIKVLFKQLIIAHLLCLTLVSLVSYIHDGLAAPPEAHRGVDLPARPQSLPHP